MSKRIQAIDVDVFYGKFKAVEGVNIDIAPRSVTAFIGPSGCGKTTFLRSINRMHEVLPGATVDGQLLLDGEDIYGPGVDRSASVPRSAWSSSARTRSPRCPSATTCWPATSSTAPA